MVRAFSLIWIALLVAFPAAAAPAAAAFEPFVSYPAVHGDKLVFVSGGEIWRGEIPASPESVVAAQRISGPGGTASHLSWSPDGRWIAYSARTGTNTDVFALDPADGSVRRLTHHPAEDLVLGWTPDGTGVIYSSGRHDPLGRPELWRVPVQGGASFQYGFGPCGFASFEPGGHRLVFQPGADARLQWRGYRGGKAPDLWLGALEERRFARLASDPANDFHPLWVKDRIAFLSDRDGSLDVYSVRPAGDDLRQHTFFAPDVLPPTSPEGYDIEWPSAGAEPGSTRIAFTQGGRLALVDLAGNSLRRFTVRFPEDVQPPGPAPVPLGPTLEGYALSPNGRQLLLMSRGEIFVRPLGAEPEEAGLDGLLDELLAPDPVRLTTSGGSREWVADVKDDREVIAWSDRAGHDSILSMSMEGARREDILIEYPSNVVIVAAAASPGARHVATVDGNGRLALADVQTGDRWTVADGWQVDAANLRFSPDGLWLAYAAGREGSPSQVFLHSLERRTSYPVSDGFHADGMPRWDPSGRYLYFLSTRFLDPYMSGLGGGFTYFWADGVLAVPLAAKAPPPGEDPAEGGPRAVEGLMTVDTEGLAGRAVSVLKWRNIHDFEAVLGGLCWISTLPRSLGEEENVESPLGPSDELLYCQTGTDGDSELIAEDVSGFATSLDGSVLAFHQEEDGQNFLSVQSVPESASEDFSNLEMEGFEEAGAPETPVVSERIDLNAIQFEVDPRQEWEQILGETWRTYGEIGWYRQVEPQAREALRAKYAALLPGLRSRGELEDVLEQMLGDIGISHAYTVPPEEEAEQEEKDGSLGADLAFRDGAWHIERILNPGPWTSEMGRSPLAAPHLGIGEGAVLLAVEGEPVDAGGDLDRLLAGRGSQTVSLTLASTAAGEDGRTVTVKALNAGEEGALRYGDWLERNRRRVDERSGGRLGYIHLASMEAEGLARFTSQMIGQRGKAGLVVDIRGNRGGYVAPYILKELAGHAWMWRFGPEGWRPYPEDSFEGRLTFLIDGETSSDGELFAESARRLGLGTLVGSRTNGYLLAITHYYTLDRGRVTWPLYGFRERDGRWLVENQGVAPDLAVDVRPEDYLLDRDPQLDAAVDRLLPQLEQKPAQPSPVAGAQGNPR